ncbi:MAG: hypothetical protein QM784_04185, partial [Polyangiaceae bacterium]
RLIGKHDRIRTAPVLYETARISIPTLFDAYRGTSSHDTFDERLFDWSARILRCADAKLNVVDANPAAVGNLRRDEQPSVALRHSDHLSDAEASHPNGRRNRSCSRFLCGPERCVLREWWSSIVPIVVPLWRA